MQYAVFRDPKRGIALNISLRPSRLCGERAFYYSINLVLDD